MTPLQVSVLGAVIASVALHIAILLRCVRFWHCSELGGLVTSTLNVLRSWCQGDGALDDVSAEVLKRNDARRAQMIRGAAHLCSGFCLPIILFVIAGVLAGNREVDPVPHALHTLTYLCFLLPGCGWRLEPSGRLAALWCSLVMTLQSLTMLPLRAGPRLFAASNVPTIFIAILTVAFMRSRVAVPWLLVFFVCRQWSGDCNDSIFAEAVGNLTWAIGIGSLAVLMESRAAAQLRTEVQSEIMQERETATSALLNTLYDVVVKLDSDLQITGEVRPLAQFLIRNGLPLGSLNFLNLLVDADRELASTRLHQCLDSRRSMAEVMRLPMCSGNGTLEVEAFCIYSQGFDRSKHFMLGLREFGESQELQSTGAQHLDAAGLQGQSAEWLPKDAEVVVNPWEGSCPILWCSTGFNHLIGGVPTGFSLLRLVDEPESCILWLQETVNFALTEETDSGGLVTGPLEVVLHPQFGMDGQQFRAHCQVASVNHECTDPAGESPSVNLVFRNFECEPARAASCSSSRSPSSASSSGQPPRPFRPVGRGTQQQPDEVQMGSLSATLVGRPLSL